MFKKLVVLLALVLGGLAAFIATRPSEFLIVRTRTFAAPPEVVFDYVSDFHRWTEWSPWEKLDPDLVRTHSGAPSGKGAIYEWSGNKKVGKGRMEIIGEQPPNRLDIKLDFLAPFEAHNQSVMTLEPGGAGTRMVWTMNGHANFMTKLMSVFMNMDKLIGADFERGLANLKAVVER